MHPQQFFYVECLVLVSQIDWLPFKAQIGINILCFRIDITDQFQLVKTSLKLFPVYFTRLNLFYWICKHKWNRN